MKLHEKKSSGFNKNEIEKSWTAIMKLSTLQYSRDKVMKIISRIMKKSYLMG